MTDTIDLKPQFEKNIADVVRVLHGQGMFRDFTFDSEETAVRMTMAGLNHSGLTVVPVDLLARLKERLQNIHVAAETGPNAGTPWAGEAAIAADPLFQNLQRLLHESMIWRLPSVA